MLSRKEICCINLDRYLLQKLFRNLKKILKEVSISTKFEV